MAQPPDFPRDLDRAAIEQAAQRTAEQTALRKVRKELDTIEAADARQRKLVRRIAMIGIVLILGSMLAVWVMLSANRDQLRGAPVSIPSPAKK